MFHERSPLQQALERAGATRAAHRTRLLMAGSNATQERLDRLGVMREVLFKLAEVEQQPMGSRIREKNDLEKGLKTLSEWARRMSGPDMPNSVWEDMCYGHCTEWPLLDAATESALEKHCDDNLFCKEMMFMLRMK